MLNVWCDGAAGAAMRGGSGTGASCLPFDTTRHAPSGNAMRERAPVRFRPYVLEPNRVSVPPARSHVGVRLTKRGELARCGIRRQT